LILLIDNYDSFTFNLLHALQQLGEGVRVARNDALPVEDIETINPEILVLSPGPGTPDRAGISVPAIRASLGRRPILGVCLGHQALGVALGGRVTRARQLVHGKTRPIHHDGSGLFFNLPSPLTVARYHSLVLDETTLPPDLEVAARSADGDIMAIRHRNACAHGVQFHPESFLTVDGPSILRNFLNLARRSR
jgi:anthranilate synthase/aminodeoxychorismate synthase-like glutamine amidotransferase